MDCNWWQVVVVVVVCWLGITVSVEIDVEKVNSTKISGEFENDEGESLKPSQPNWSVFTSIDDIPNVHESISVVRSIPVQHFWDYHRGHYKFGILGESVEDLYPQYVTVYERKVSLDSPTYNVTSANTDEIFPHLVLVIKHLASTVEYIESTVEELLAEGDNFALKIIRVANETGIEWRTASEIRTSREVLEIKKRIVDAEMLRAITRDSYRNETFRFYNEKKLGMLELQHKNILNAIIESHARQDAVEVEKQEDLLRLADITEAKRLETQISILEHAHNASLERLAVEVQLGIRAIKFRAIEEGRAERDNEDVALNIMRAKAESMRRGFEEFVTMIHVKGKMLLQDCFENPTLVFRYLLILSAALSLYIIMLETSEAFRAYITSKVSTPAVLKEAFNRKDGDDQTSMEDLLVLSSESSSRLNSMSEVFKMAHSTLSREERSGSSILLPNILIVGSPGTGKTMSAVKLAKQSGFPFIIVCGGDLLAVGGNSSASVGSMSASSSAPGRYLREVLLGASSANKGRGFIVILDEVETIITDRGKRKEKVEQLMQDESESETSVFLESRECLHILLNMLRVNSMSLGVIITTSLKLQFVDPALLDRMDRVLTLDLPDASLRYTHCLIYTKKLLSSYMNDYSRQILDSLCAHGKLDLPNINENTFTDLIAPVLGDNVNTFALLKNSADLFKEENIISAKKTKKPKKSSIVNDSCSEKKQEGETRATIKTDTDDGTGKDRSVASSSVSSSQFNLVFCLYKLVQCSDGWSHRELTKLIQSIQSAVIATEECVLTSDEWLRQIEFKVSSKIKSDSLK